MKTVVPLLISIFLSAPYVLHAQGEVRASFTRKDSLRGSLTPARTCYDITFYDLTVSVDPEEKTIDGSNTIHFDIVEETELLQVDLFENMQISKIILNDGKKLKFRREYNVVFIELPEKMKPSSQNKIRIEYGGTPISAKRPPWDGGVVWQKDSVGNPWVAVTCQGTGASLWWPNKDHQSDEPDSMLISISIPYGLENVSNGRLRSVTNLKDGWKKYEWFVSYPINNYNVTFNIGNFAHVSDWYVSKDADSLSLDYYVLPQELNKAKRQFAQVQPMMDFFYEYFGPYPFAIDGYKLVQSPHLGMEHQSAVAYGNRYLNGYAGTASSEIGLSFDFIIMHETAHEWWGNSITSNDIADMWIHESFGAYSEGLYVEAIHGYDEGMKYINGKKQNVQNDKPIIGPKGVNQPGSSDMYDKGQLILNTLRHVIDDDVLWRKILRGLNDEFKYQTIDGEQVFKYINEETGTDFNYFFDQYFRHAALPELRINLAKKEDDVTAYYRWVADVKNFKMPIKVMTSMGQYETIYPTSKVQSIELKGIHPDEFKVAEDQYFVNVNISKTYIDPRR